jgi:hypothetical protein
MDCPVEDEDLLWSAEVRLTVSVPHGWTEADEQDLSERLERLVPEIQAMAKTGLPDKVQVAVTIV